VLALMAMTVIAMITTAQESSTPAMTLEVDETQAPRRIAFVDEEIRVRPGALALAYPRWIPGEHGPTGPIQQFVTLRVHSGNTTLPRVIPRTSTRSTSKFRPAAIESASTLIRCWRTQSPIINCCWRGTPWSSIHEASTSASS
jgi:hypothetical protein